MGSVCTKNGSGGGGLVKAKVKKSQAGGDASAEVRLQAVSEEDIVRNVLISSKNALSQLRSFGGSFVSEKFSASLEGHHAAWVEQRYDWFVPREQVPKNMSGPTDPSYISSFDLARALQLADELAAKAKLALDAAAGQMDGDPFQERFRKAADHARAAHREVALAIKEMQLSSSSPTDASFIPVDVLGAAEGSARDMRDWFIYRDSVNAFEFIVDLFTNLT